MPGPAFNPEETLTEQRSRIRPLAILAATLLGRVGFGYLF